MLRIDSLNKRFGTLQALNDLSFHVNPGEVFGFVGSNGAGKTTCMRIMLGVMSADSGDVSWNGAPISFSQRQKIGYMPEERGLYPRMEVGPQLTYLARLHGLSKAEADEAVSYWTQRLGIEARVNDSVQKLSLGNQQRVQLAAALVHNPDILVLDEPFSGLDPVAVDVMSDVLREKAKSGVPVIFSSHQLDLVERLCDRIGIVSQGHMVAEGTVDELRSGSQVRLAAAIAAPFESVSAALSRFGITAEADPLEGTSEAPSRPGVTRLVFTEPAGVSDQDILQSLLTCGPVHEFAPRRAHLNELFKDVVVAPAPGDTESSSDKKKSRGLLGALLGSKKGAK
ncbi:ATP-binding cassette domain-containing protein [Arcanobacterium haemolyticum]|nr:ATP-binding cassette domain-containing protein [Arcanobacterium haemolyticum]